MANRISSFIRTAPRVWKQSRGITGLETAIVLIAFVVVSSVFAFAALSTGLFSADKSKDTINAGLSEARGTLEVRGTIIAKANGGKTAIDEISFQVANAAGGEAVDITPDETLITYSDVDQLVTLTSADWSATGLGNADTDKLVEPGEMYEIKLTGLEAKLVTDLPKDKPFTLQVKPPQGAVVNIQRRTPVVLETFNDLG